MTAKERFDLGISYLKEGRFDEAIKSLSSIRREEVDSKTYAWVQFRLGRTYYDKDQKDLAEAIKVWSNITRDDNPEAYTWAQVGLGFARYAKDELDQAIDAWSNITRDDNPEAYAWARVGLGVAHYAQDDKPNAIAAWSEIDPKHSLTVYTQAQLNLGKVYSLDKEEEELARDAYKNVRDFSYYKSERGFKILKCTLGVRKDLHSLAKNIDEVLKYLQIIPGFESKVAHYTRPQIAFDLFDDKKNDNDKEPSNFRLSTIRGVNDPTEGLVLNGYWNQQGIPETIHTNDTATFVSCFTFNHDNLNQFRLYGKENGREATGVSLVFNKEFFSNQADTLEFIAGPSTDLSSKSAQIKLNETGKIENDNKKPLIGKSTLYRCIYLDPETGYSALAQRDKSTFYREHNEDEDTDAKGKWKDYYELISKIERCVETRLFNKENNEDTDTKGKRGKYHKSISTKEEGVETHLLNKENNDDNSVSSILKSIFTKDHLYNKCNKDEKQKILEAIRFTLLPLQYLVKHIAFQEEQECRIMYITQFRDEKIHSDREEQKMYVEYEESVVSHIDKIWLSPGAAKYQDFFRIRLDQGSGKSKVRISQNPFRNKE